MAVLPGYAPKKPDPLVASATELAAARAPAPAMAARLAPPKRMAGRPAKARYGLRQI
jgi:hypothetical protein